MAPIKAKEYVTLGFSYKITKGLSEPGGREYTCPTVLDRVPKEDAANFESAAFL